MSKELRIDFIGIGPQKTGSTWLDEILRDHPEAYVPEATKETWYFDQSYEENLSGFVGYFKNAKDDQQTGEICPTYFDSPEALSRIKKHFPDVKIIISLRNPVAKAESLFRHHLRKGRVGNVFTEAANQMPEIITSGHYSQYIPHWIEAFGEDKVHVILLDDIAVQPEDVYKRVCEFLDISSEFTSEKLTDKVNQAGMPKYPALAKISAKLVTYMKKNKFHGIVNLGKKMGLKKVYGGGKEIPGLSENERVMLQETYSADIDYVEKLLNKKLDSWR
jgi:hypothetical protein